MTNTKPAVDNRSVSISLKSKTEKVYIPHFKRNNKEKVYFARLGKGKSFDVDAEVSRPKSTPIVESIINLFLCLPVTFVMFLVMLDQIVLC